MTTEREIWQNSLTIGSKLDINALDGRWYTATVTDVAEEFSRAINEYDQMLMIDIDGLEQGTHEQGAFKEQLFIQPLHTYALGGKDMAMWNTHSDEWVRAHPSSKALRHLYLCTQSIPVDPKYKKRVHGLSETGEPEMVDFIRSHDQESYRMYFTEEGKSKLLFLDRLLRKFYGEDYRFGFRSKN